MSDQATEEPESLSEEDAIAAVAASARRLFPTVTHQQARDLASAILRDLAARGLRLMHG